MKRFHVAFVSFPHHPPVNPTLPIASVLTRRGHRVSYVTSDRFASRVQQIGAEFVRCPEFRPESDTGADVKDPLDGAFFQVAARTLEQITSRYEQDRPDLIIYNWSALAGRVLAHKLKVPAVKTSPVFALCSRTYERHSEALALQVAELGKSVSQFLERYGILSNDFTAHREKLNIYLFPRLFQPDGDVFGDSYFYAGRCAAEQPHYGTWKNRSSPDRRVVLVSNSTTYVQGSAYFRTCIDALSELKCHILLSIGDSGNPATLEPLPDGVEVVQHNSHVKILPYVDAFICTGGIITASEATYHGVPLVVTSLGILENEVEGDRFEELGIAIHVKKAAENVEALKSAAKRALEDTAMRTRVKEVQRMVQREPGGEETVNRIEAYLEDCYG